MSGSSRRLDAAGAPQRTGRPAILFLWLAALVLALDQLTKLAAVAALAPGQSVPLLDDVLRLTLVHNVGAAFGMVRVGWLLIAIGLAVCLVIPALVVRGGGSAAQVAVLAVIWAGSAGNVLDRLRTGAVIDFIDLRVWPVFNVADIAITVGFVVLAGQLLRRRS